MRTSGIIQTSAQTHANAHILINMHDTKEKEKEPTEEHQKTCEEDEGKNKFDGNMEK